MSPVRVLEACFVGLFLAFVLLKARAQLRRGRRPLILRDWREVLAVGAFFGWFGVVLIHALGAWPALGRPLLAEGAWLDGPWLDGLGLGCQAAALLLFGLALRGMGSSWHIGIEDRGGDELVTDGLYAWSRHPIYVAMDLFALGALLVDPAPFFAVTSACIWIGVDLRMREEERFLLSHHGEAYRAYSARTARYFGRRRSP